MYKDKKFEENDKCPHCEFGYLKFKKSKFGGFLGCSEFPYCAFKVNINEPLDIGQAGWKE